MAFNWGGFASGGLGGAGLGATIGSIIPGVGTAIGAGIGALGGAVAGGATGSKGKFKQTPNKYNPQQQQALNSLLQQGLQGYQNPGTGFEPIEQQARTNFQKSIPSLAERFTSLGGSDTRGSSDFAGMLGGAQSEFEQGLAALKAQYGQQNQQNSLRLIGLGLNPQTESYYQQGNAGIGPQLLQTGGQLAGNYLAGGGSYGSQAPQFQINDQDKSELMKLIQNYFANKGR